MSKICIKEVIAKLESGSRPKGGASTTEGIPSLGAEHLSYEGRIVFSKPKYIEQSFYDQLKSGILKDQDVLIVKDGATTGKVAIWMSEFEKACINEHVFRIEIDSNKALPKYIFYFLISSYGNNQVLKDFRGATVGGISRSFVDKVKMSMPSLSEQKQIVRILDTADTLRQKRKEQLKLLDDYLKSVFFEMFGDPLRNEKKFDVVPIRETVVDVKYGTSKKANIRKGQFPILRMNNITYSGEWNFTDLKYIDLETNEIEKYTVKKGDLLFNRTNSKELVGKTAVFNSDQVMVYAGYLIRCRFDKKKANPVYVSYFLNSSYGKSKFSHMCKNIVGMANINAQELQDINIILPPADLQNKFASIVEQVEQTKQKMRASLDEMDNHFNALMQRYFG
ncbi:MAG: restriction endonuclease subunit S [Candidatus Scalindua sp.]